MSNNRHHGPGPIPNRWLHCPRNASAFIADKFLAFKTPLSERFSLQMPKECQFQPNTVFSFAKLFKLKIGLWIDLTNTKRFYDRREVELKDCQYMKLSCRGHGETPSREQTQSFIEIVDTFIAEHPLEMIGVHCTHGFNRTGFLIISYLVEKMDCSVEAALMAFSSVRPPGIYKEDYIKELFRRYDDEEDAPPPPAMPDWCFEYEEEDDNQTDYSFNANSSNSASRKRKADDSPISTAEDSTTAHEEENDEADTADDQSSSTSGQEPKKKKRKENINLNATFMSGVPGTILFTDREKVQELQALVQKMCNWTTTGFPGSQPVSMDRNNMALLSLKPYQVSWKADGTRYMMLILKEHEIYFFDRNFACFKIENLRFPLKDNLQAHLTNTLLDGEMVIDKVNGLSTPRYLVYDVIHYNGQNYSERPFFKDRLACIDKLISAPRYEAIKYGIIDRRLEPFGVRPKTFWDVTVARGLLGPKFAKTLSHEPDGLIFQPSLSPYKAGESQEVLKWKPLELNSVDFLLKIGQESGIGILNRKVGYLYVGQLDQPFSTIKYTKHLKDLNGKIIECKFENNVWVFMRERVDKPYPNSYKTAKAVCLSIKEPVTTEMLLEFIDNHRFIRDSEIMPPPPPKQQQQQHQQQQHR